MTVTIEDGVTTVGKGAFTHCEDLNSVRLGSSLTSLGDGAFAGCTGLTEINIPDSVTRVGVSAFYKCTALKLALVGKNTTIINGYAFGGCTSLENAFLGESVTTIGENAFNGCTGLKQITLGDYLSTVEANAFGGCSLLSDVYYTGTEDDWSYVSVKSGNTYLTSANLHYGESGAVPVTGTHTVTLDPVADGLEKTAHQVKNGETYSFLPETLTWDGYDFTGWFTIYGEQVKASDTVALGEDITLTALWSAKQKAYQVVFDANGGTLTDNRREYTNGRVYGELPVPVRDGFEFTGWYTSAAGGSKITGDTVVKLYDDVTYYYAHWQGSSFDVALNPVSGTVAPDTVTLREGAEVGDLPVAVRDGYNFAGWFDAPENGNRITGETIADRQVSTYYAHWMANAASEIPTPSFRLMNINGGKQVIFSLPENAPEGSVIRFETGGAEPDKASPEYTAPLSLTRSITVKAVTESEGKISSVLSVPVSVAQADTPDFSSQGAVSSGYNVTIRTGTNGADIYYTTDGSVPSASNGLLYDAGRGISIENTVTIRVVAVKSGLRNSEIAERSFTVVKSGVDVHLVSSTAKAGDNVNVPVYITGSSPQDRIGSYTLAIQFDPEVFEFVGLTPSESKSVSDYSMTLPGDTGLVKVSCSSVSDTGELFSINLKALTSDLDGEYTVSAVKAQSQVNTMSQNNVDINVRAGSIKLVGSENTLILTGAATFSVNSAVGNETVSSAESISGGAELTAQLQIDRNSSVLPDNEDDLPSATAFVVIYGRNGMLLNIDSWDIDLKDPDLMFMRTVRVPDNVTNIGAVKMMVVTDEMVPVMMASRI